MLVTTVADIEIQIVSDYDEAGSINDSKVFSKGTPLSFEVIDYCQTIQDGKLQDDPDIWNIQFADGSVAFAVSRAWFDIVEGEDELPEIEEWS